MGFLKVFNYAMLCGGGESNAPLLRTQTPKIRTTKSKLDTI